MAAILFHKAGKAVGKKIIKLKEPKSGGGNSGGESNKTTAPKSEPEPVKTKEGEAEPEKTNPKTIEGEKTLPSKKPDPNAKPRGKRTEINEKMDSETKTSLIRENEGADALAKKGYDIEQNPDVLNTTRNPDYKIEGKVFDCYSPYNKNKSVRGIWSEVSDKVVTKKQTERVFLNLENWEGDKSLLQKQFSDYPIDGLKEVMILDKNGNIQHINLK